MDQSIEKEPLRKAPTRRFQAQRQAIVRAAVQVINRKGVRGMTLGEVAAQLDRVPTAVIYYFKSKEELAAVAFEQAIERFEALIAASAGAGSEAERIRALVAGFFEERRSIAKGERDNIAIFNDVRALNWPSVNAAYVEMFRHARRLLAPVERLPRLHRNARAHLLLSELFWVNAWLRQVNVADYPRAADRMGDILTGGLLPAGAAWPTPQTISLFPADSGSAKLGLEQFLSAATELINAEGYHGASVERISARLNVSKGAFYHHNETKDELVVACFQRTFDITWRAISEAEAAGGSGLQRLVTTACALIEHQVLGDAPLLRTSALTTAPESMYFELIDRMDRISYRFASMICDGVADGSIRPVDVNVAAQMLTAAINAAAELQFWAPGLTADRVVGHYIRPLFEGLAAPPADL